MQKKPCRWRLIDWLASTCHTFSSEHRTWGSTPFVCSWKYASVSRTLLKLPAWTSGGGEGLMKMSGATRSFVSEEYWCSSATCVLLTLGPKLITAFGIGHGGDLIWDQTTASFLFVRFFVFLSVTFIIKCVIYYLLLHRHGKKKQQHSIWMQLLELVGPGPATLISVRLKLVGLALHMNKTLSESLLCLAIGEHKGKEQAALPSTVRDWKQQAGWSMRASCLPPSHSVLSAVQG